MNLVKKYFSNFVLRLPVMWFLATIFAGAITWWHGGAKYFIYLTLLLTIVAVLWVLLSKVKEYPSFLTFIFSVFFILTCIAFNVYGLIVLFIPQWKSWGSWNIDGHWVNIYFQLPSDFNYGLLLIFLGLLLVYGGKKFFELDMDAMKKAAYKQKEVSQKHLYYLNRDPFDIIFKSRFLVKSENWLHTFALFFCCYVILPFGGAAGALGSNAANFGNNIFVATVFFIFGYMFLCICVAVLVKTYARYRLIKALEKEMGVKLKPAIYQK